MIITHFTSQIIPVAIGLGFSYGLFVVANRYEGRLRTIGEDIGWVLIVLTILSSLFSFFYSIYVGNEANIKEGCTVIKLMQQEETPMVNDDEAIENESTQGTDNTKKLYDEGENGTNSGMRGSHNTN